MLVQALPAAAALIAIPAIGCAGGPPVETATSAPLPESASAVAPPSSASALAASAASTAQPMSATGGACVGPPEYEERNPDRHGPGFPAPSPVTNARPDVLVETTVRVPKRLSVHAENGRVAVSLDAADLEEVTLKMGCHLLLGARLDYAIGPSSGDLKSTGESLQGNTIDFSHGGDVSYLEKGSVTGPTKVRVTLSIFQTDIPAQHAWMPEGALYKVLTTRVLEATVP